MLRHAVSFAACCIALLLLAACNDVLGIGGRAVAVSLTQQRAWDPPPVLLVYIEGGRPVELTGRRDGQRVDRQIQAPKFAELSVVVRLIGAQGDTIAATNYRQDFERGNIHWVAVDVGPRRPIGICIGTVLTIATNSPPDTAFVMYGQIPEDAIC